MSFYVNLSQLAGLRDQIKKFGEQVQGRVAMEGVAAMAFVMYEEVRSHVPVSAREHIFYGKNSRKTGVTYTFQPGTLKGAIYRVYSPERSGKALKIYRISWNHRKAPYGFMVEYGTSRAPATPFMRPSLPRLPAAMDAGRLRMSKALAELGAVS